MNFVDNFFKCFFSSVSVIAATENDEEFVCEIASSSFALGDIESIQKTFDFLQSNDKLTLTITFGSADPVSFYSESSTLSDFKTRLEAEHLHQEHESVISNLKITKRNIEGDVTIYDLETFTNTLENLSVAESFFVFSRALARTSFVNFKVLNLESPFNTANIFFSPLSISSQIKASDGRDRRLENIRTVCNYANIEEHRLTPDDFKWKVENIKYSRLYLLFNKFSVVVSVIYLFDITILKANTLEFKINGYKSLNGKVDITALSAGGKEEYFNIYNWVYEGGNLADKIGLARNIISLHFAKAGNLDLKGGPFQSIQSSYKVYEKQNVKQYIEIRNKVSDQLLDFNNRANKVIETFASGFQKSALALISFYISAIVLKVLGKGELVNVFTLDATALSIAFLLCSFIYYLLSRWEVKQQRQRFVDSYNNLKARYTDLLDQGDIQRILNNDKEFTADLVFIDSKLKAYSRMWFSFLAVLLLVTLFLFCTYNLTQLIDAPLWKQLFGKR